MKTIQITLHALPDELISVIEGWLTREGLLTVAVWLTPAFSVTQSATANALRSEISRNGLPFRVCVAHKPFNLHAATLHEFMSKNEPECTVDIGTLTEEGLTESSITITTLDNNEWRFWSRIAKDIKNSTGAGLWAVSPVTGTRKLFKNSRYTTGAAELAREGRKLLPIAGWNYFEIVNEERSH